MPAHQLARDLENSAEHLPGWPPGGGLHGQPGRQPPGEARHPDHEELIQVAREDRQEPHALE